MTTPLSAAELLVGKMISSVAFLALLLALLALPLLGQSLLALTLLTLALLLPLTLLPLPLLTSALLLPLALLPALSLSCTLQLLSQLLDLRESLACLIGSTRFRTGSVLVHFSGCLLDVIAHFVDRHAADGLARNHLGTAPLPQVLR